MLTISIHWHIRVSSLPSDLTKLALTQETSPVGFTSLHISCEQDQLKLLSVFLLAISTFDKDNF